MSIIMFSPKISYSQRILRIVPQIHGTLLSSMPSRFVLLWTIVVLVVFLFSVTMNFANLSWTSDSYFEPVLSDKERTGMLELLSVFQECVEKSNITYFMGGGTLIGSVRHHGPVPWDDDIDIYVKSDHKSRLIDAISRLGPRYALYANASQDGPTQRWKFYRSTIHLSPNEVSYTRWFIHRPFTWPYIDMFFFQENATHVWDEVGWYTYNKALIYPLIRRPFAGMWLYSPCDVDHALADYRIELCQSRAFSHLLEVPIVMWRQRIVLCDRLKSRFPFINRTKVSTNELIHSTDFSGYQMASNDVETKEGILEALMIDQQKVHEVHLLQPVCSVHYGLDDRNIKLNSHLMQ